MGRMSKRKGAAGEREAAEKLNQILGTRFHRGRQFHGGTDSPDIAGDLPGLHVEVKRCEHLSLYKAFDQANRDASVNQVPIVMHRANGKPWLLVVDADNLIRLLDVIDTCRGKLDPSPDSLPPGGTTSVSSSIPPGGRTSTDPLNPTGRTTSVSSASPGDAVPPRRPQAPLEGVPAESRISAALPQTSCLHGPFKRPLEGKQHCHPNQERSPNHELP